MPFVVVVGPAAFVAAAATTDTFGAFLVLDGGAFDPPGTALDPAPAGGVVICFWQGEGVRAKGFVQVLVGPSLAFVGEERSCPAESEPATLIFVEGEGEADTGARGDACRRIVGGCCGGVG